MSARHSGMASRVAVYLYDSWIRACGAGWTRRQVFVGYASSLTFPLLLLAYAAHADLGWSTVQTVAALLIAWDLCGGAIGYAHRAIKERNLRESGRVHFLHHNLQHIHPLILMFFHDPRWLLALTAYWLATFFAYVELLEADPETGRRRISRTGEKWVVVFEIAVAATLIGASFWTDGVSPESRAYGVCSYALLGLSTLVLIHVPVPFQRTVAVLLVVLMVFAGLFLVVPRGFEWLLPVYGLKLLVGYTAKERWAELARSETANEAPG